MQLRPLFPLFIALCKPRLELSLCKKMILSRIVMIFAKGGFFSEGEIRFSNLQNRLLQITILNLKFEIPAHITVNNLFKFQAQDGDLE